MVDQIAKKFVKIAALPLSERKALHEILFKQNHVTNAAKYLVELGIFEKQSTAYQYCYKYKQQARKCADWGMVLTDKLEVSPMDLATSNKLSKANTKAVPLSVKESTKLLKQAEGQLGEALLKTKEIMTCMAAQEHIQRKFAEFSALTEMQKIALLQYERTLHYIAMEEQSGRHYQETRLNLETLMKFMKDVASLQMDLGVLVKVDIESHKHLHVSVTNEQEELMKRFRDQKLVDEVTLEALTMILDGESSVVPQSEAELTHGEFHLK